MPPSMCIHDDPEIGSRFIADELRQVGIVAGENRVSRLCTMQRIWSVHSAREACNDGPELPCTMTLSNATSRVWPQRAVAH